MCKSKNLIGVTLVHISFTLKKKILPEVVSTLMQKTEIVMIYKNIYGNFWQNFW